MITLRKRTPFPDTLIILPGMSAHNFPLLHRNPKVFFYKLNRRKNGKIGIPFTAPGTANRPDLLQRF